MQPARKCDSKDVSRHSHKEYGYDQDYSRYYSRDDYQSHRQDYEDNDDRRRTRGRTFTYSKNDRRWSKHETDDEDTADFDVSSASGDYLSSLTLICDLEFF